MKIKNRLFILSCLLGLKLSAQDIHFSQFYMAPLNQNPAMAGALHDIEAIANYREQWKSVAQPYKTTACSYSMRLNKANNKKGYWAGGLNFFNDKAGDGQLATFQASLNAAYHVHTGQYSTLGIGLQGGYAQRSVDYSALTWGNQYDGITYNQLLPGREPVNASAHKGYADAGAGLVWTYNNTAGLINVTDNHDLKMNLGFSVLHVNQPASSFYATADHLYMKYVLHGKATISIKNTRMALVPGFMAYRQVSLSQLYIGSLFRYALQQESKYTANKNGTAFSIGAFLRLKDAVSIPFLLEYDHYSIGLSYDVNISKLNTASTGRGGFELSFRFVGPGAFGNSAKARYNLN